MTETREGERREATGGGRGSDRRGHLRGAPDSAYLSANAWMSEGDVGASNASRAAPSSASMT